jgi:hypothetical protein
MIQNDDKIVFLPTQSEDSMRYVDTDLARLGHRLDVVRSLRSEVKSSWALTYWLQVERQLLKKLKNANPGIH